jgi:SPP1 gp7 family putative phage head morphogenesis protein
MPDIDELVRQSKKEIKKAEDAANAAADKHVTKSYEAGLAKAEEDVEKSLAMDVATLEQLKKTNYNLISGFSSMQQKETERILRNGVMNGHGVNRIARDISRAFRVSKYRARTIARTEVIRASNMARLDGWKQSGIVKRKEWLTAFDDRTCPSCVDLDGQTISIEKQFKGSVGEEEVFMQMPPAHPNCRCTAVPIIEQTKARDDDSILLNFARWDEKNFPTTRRIEMEYGNELVTIFNDAKNRVRELIFRNRAVIEGY